MAQTATSDCKSKLGIFSKLRNCLPNHPGGDGCGCFFFISLQLPAKESLGGGSSSTTSSHSTPSSTHSWVIFFNVGSTSKNDRGVGKFPYWDIRWSKSHFPNTWVCFGIHPVWSSLFISESVNSTAGNSWRRKEQFDSFTKKLLTFFLRQFPTFSFCFNNKGDILRPLELLQSLSTLSYLNCFLK